MPRYRVSDLSDSPHVGFKGICLVFDRIGFMGLTLRYTMLKLMNQPHFNPFCKVIPFGYDSLSQYKD